MKKVFINSLLVLLLLVGIILVFNNQIKNFLIKQTSEQYAVSQLTKKETKANQKQEASFDFEGVQRSDTSI